MAAIITNVFKSRHHIPWEAQTWLEEHKNRFLSAYSSALSLYQTGEQA